MKLTAIVTVLMLTGCAVSSPSKGFDISDMDTFIPDCGQAKKQVAYLQARITAFHDYFADQKPNLDQRKYYTRLKNNLWSLRSSCSALQQ